MDIVTTIGKELIPTTIVKLDSETSSALRKGQVITKISDVVRELVDNSVDAGAPSVQVLLNNYGLEKIEVRDTGHGILSTDLKHAVAGGYTSKLKNVQHPSCGNSYGFRGEAISSICNVAYVSLITKTIDEPQARKYVLDRNGVVVNESKVAYGKGTIVIAEKIFSNVPVRLHWIQDKKKCTSELNEIEGYLKAIAIANCQTHISFYHNGSLIWTKASVPTIDQALITVLGHKLAKNLVKCGPVNVVVEEEEKRKRTLEAFLLKKPVDMKSMSFTSNKLTMIFVNRKRVYIREFEKLIQRYVAAIVEKPAPADQRRFPVAVLNIRVPFDEADFNRDMDKSKLFLVHKEELSKKLEEVLVNFYGVDLKETLVADSKIVGSSVNGSTDNSTFENNIEPEVTVVQSTPEKSRTQDSMVTSPVVPIQDSVEPQGRKDVILAFLENIPSASSSNFSQSPIKEGYSNTHFPKFHPAVKNLVNPQSKDSGHVATDLNDENEHPAKTFSNPRGPDISNFDLNIDGWSWTQTQGSTTEQLEQASNKQESPVVHLKDWVHGRMTDAHGDLIQNVAMINRPPAREPCGAAEELSVHWSNAVNQSVALPPCPSFGCKSPYEVVHPPASKRPRTSEHGSTRINKDVSQPSNGISFSSSKQVTLDSYKNWGAPGNRLTQSIPNTPNAPAGVRLPLSASMRTFTPKTKRNDNSTIGIPPKSIRDYWRNSSSVSIGNSSASLLGRKESVNLERQLTSTSPSSSQGISSSKLIGEITGSDFYAAQVHELVGVFSPMSMLHLYPSLKYDLKISFEKVNVSPPQDSPNPISKYVICQESVTRLFAEFLNAVDPCSEPFSKIFHTLQNLPQKL